MQINLPYNWKPRHYQRKAWCYLQRGGKHAELVWHRRSGKDELSLHYTATAAFRRKATYWHMLPQAAQARKAIWKAINPHTGKRRIDEAFPPAIRKSTNDNEMFIEFVNGSTWQVVGSDNYNSLVGAPPAGVVYSEWALANPAAKAYLRPIMMENDGWQIFITTPRGKNHAFSTYNTAKSDPDAFAQRLTINDTQIIAPERIAKERLAYINDYGEEQGIALFEQEWLCDWTAAILGAYYGHAMKLAESQGRICDVKYDPKYPVYSAWDIGKTDDTSIWFFQVKPDGIYIIDFETYNNQDVDFYVKLLKEKDFPHEKLYFPHDAKAKRLGMKRTVEEQFRAAGFSVHVLAQQSIQDGIQAARKTMKISRWDAEKCANGIEALKMYRREWDTENKVFKITPVHDWSSHPADAYRYLGQAWRELPKEDKKDSRIEGIQDMSLDELWSLQGQMSNTSDRI